MSISERFDYLVFDAKFRCADGRKSNLSDFRSSTHFATGLVGRHDMMRVAGSWHVSAWILQIFVTSGVTSDGLAAAFHR